MIKGLVKVIEPTVIVDISLDAISIDMSNAAQLQELESAIASRVLRRHRVRRLVSRFGVALFCAVWLPISVSVRLQSLEFCTSP